MTIKIISFFVYGTFYAKSQMTVWWWGGGLINFFRVENILTILILGGNVYLNPTRSLVKFFRKFDFSSFFGRSMWTIPFFFKGDVRAKNIKKQEKSTSKQPNSTKHPWRYSIVCSTFNAI